MKSMNLCGGTLKYKALLLDIDGTLSRYSSSDIPLDPTGRVIQAISMAKEQLAVGLATSRPFSKIQNILGLLRLNGYTILHNGAQIINSSQKTVWKRPISKESVIKLAEIAANYDFQTFYSDFSKNKPFIISDKTLSSPISDIFFDGVEEKDYEAVSKKLSAIPQIAVHRLSSRWTGGYELSITHAEATKKTAVLKVADFMKVSPRDIIGIGDAHNDLPLLEACGYRVAMGNAVDELKEIADYVAPSVDEDGVAIFIEEYLLK